MMHTSDTLSVSVCAGAHVCKRPCRRRTTTLGTVLGHCVLFLRQAPSTA